MGMLWLIQVAHGWELSVDKALTCNTVFEKGVMNNGIDLIRVGLLIIYQLQVLVDL